MNKRMVKSKETQCAKKNRLNQGINLDKPCFSHGQLYVACTRVGN